MINRLDVRRGSERGRRLEELAHENGLPISEVVRRLIGGAYEDIVRTRRKQAIDTLIVLNVKDPSDPDTLSRGLEAAHEPGGLSPRPCADESRRVYAEDVILGAKMVDRHTTVSARNPIHTAVMQRLGIDRIISADSDFDRLEAIIRLDPADIGECVNSILIVPNA